MKKSLRETFEEIPIGRRRSIIEAATLKIRSNVDLWERYKDAIRAAEHDPDHDFPEEDKDGPVSRLWAVNLEVAKEGLTECPDLGSHIVLRNEFMSSIMNLAREEVFNGPA